MNYFGILLSISVIIRISKSELSSTRELLEPVLIKTSQEANIVQVLDAQVLSQSRNDSCCRTMTRVKCLVQLKDGRRSNLTLVINALPDDSFKRLLNNETGAMAVETDVYNRVVPAMEEHLNELGDNGERFWVQPIQILVNSSFIQRDIREQGYVKWHPADGLDLSECEIALVTLAKFHALTASALTSGRLVVDSGHLMSRPFMERVKHKIANYYKGLYLLLAEVVEHWDENWLNTANKLKVKSENITSELLAQFTQPNKSFRVVLHGSYSINNLSFKYGISDVYRSKRPISTKMEGFDQSYVNSPIFDVQHFLHTSPKLEVMANQSDYLLGLYIKALRSYLHRFQFEDIPSVDWLTSEFQRTRLYGFTMAINELRYLYLDENEEAPDLIETVRKAWSEQREIIYNTGMLGKRYTATIRMLLSNLTSDGEL